MSGTERCAVLMEYAGDDWHKRIVCGAPAAAVERWLVALDARPRGSEGGSGKPLAWLHVGDAPRNAADGFVATRSVGLLTDVLRAADRSLTADDLQSLRAIFERDGKPFAGEVHPA